MKKQALEQFLKENGYLKVTFSKEVNQLVNEAISKWRMFYKQSLNHKELIPFGEYGGYENKDQIKHPEYLDHKENFHITPTYQFPVYVNPTKIDEAFITTAQNLFYVIKPSLVEAAEMFSELTGLDFVSIANHLDGFTLRFLHYYPQENKTLAHYHPDKGGHTFHLYDSTPGFEKFWNNKWSNINFTHDEMVFFTGLLGQYFSKCTLKALAHRVVSSNESRSIGRDSIVLFNDYPTFNMTYNKEKFGPTQKAFLPGQNYNMEFKEFSKFFKRRGLIDSR